MNFDTVKCFVVFSSAYIEHFDSVIIKLRMVLNIEMHNFYFA